MRKYRPDVGDYMSDKAYRLYQQVKYKADHPGTPKDEAEKCKAQLQNIVERDKIPAEEKTYRRAGESDADFKARVAQAQHAPKTDNRESQAGFSWTAFSASRQRDFDLRDQMAKKYREGLEREEEYERVSREQKEAQERARQEIMAQQKARVKNAWQQQSDLLHNRFNKPYEPTGPKPKTNTDDESTEFSPVFIFFVLVILYFVFIK